MVFAYFSVGAYLLYAKMPQILFPSITLTSKTDELDKFTLLSASKDELVIREYGTSKEQCIVFFPGRHGGIKKYEASFFPI